MPGRNDISLLSEVQRSHLQVAVVMLTGCEDVSTAVEAMKAVFLKAGETEPLEETMRRQTPELQAALGHLDDASEATLEALVAALDAREHETHAHSRRVAEYSIVLGEALGVSGEALNSLRRGALDRPYQKGRPLEGAREEVASSAGAQFDASLWKSIRKRTSSRDVPEGNSKAAPCR
jgi:HD-GYP domain-containing protein (c-di-GMP phosphodiesterase class II)